MSERIRLEMLRARDGDNAAKAWARSALRLYRESTGNPAHFASQSDWKPRFEDSMRELATFAEHGNIEVIHDD